MVKLIRMLGVALVAAIASMALAGGGTASATVLCKEHPKKVEEGGKTIDKCPANMVYGKENQKRIDYKSLQPVRFIEPVEQGEEENTLIECAESEITGTAISAEPIEKEIEKATFATKEGKCESSLGSTVKVELLNLPYLATMTYEGQQTGQEGNEQVGWGQQFVGGKEGGQVELKVSQSFFLECTYTPTEEQIKSKILNGERPPFNQQSKSIFKGLQQHQPIFKLKSGGFICPKELKLQAEFALKGWQGLEQINLYIAKEAQA